MRLNRARAALALAMLAGLLGAGASVAEAPSTSPIPPARPAAKVAPMVFPGATALAPATSPIPVARPVAAEVTRFVAPDLMAIASPSRLAPLTSLVPRARPEGATAAPAPMPAVAIATPTRLAPLTSLVPRARPEEADDIILAAAPAPSGKKDRMSRKGSVCGNPAIKGEEIAVIKASVKGCGLSDGVKVTSISGVALSTPAQLDCVTAEALNSWVENALIPAVGNTGGGVAKLQVAASYACRPRNNQKGNRISEHGKGRAIDVSAIVLQNGKAISVLADWGEGRGGKILKAIRRAACGTFTTVLGPGSDRFHRDHLHLDTARGRGAYCR